MNGTSYSNPYLGSTQIVSDASNGSTPRSGALSDYGLALHRLSNQLLFISRERVEVKDGSLRRHRYFVDLTRFNEQPA